MSACGGIRHRQRSSDFPACWPEPNQFRQQKIRLPYWWCTEMHDRGPMNPETQDIQVEVTPETAQCEARQAATPTGIYDPGRRVLTIPKSRESLEILCFAIGYKDKRVVVPSDDVVLGAV